MKNVAIKVGLIMVVIGTIWTSFIFNETEKIHDSVLLKKSNSFETKTELIDSDIGYYKFYMHEFSGNEIFVQVLDTKTTSYKSKKFRQKCQLGILILMKMAHIH